MCVLFVFESGFYKAVARLQPREKLSVSGEKKKGGRKKKKSGRKLKTLTFPVIVLGLHGVTRNTCFYPLLSCRHSPFLLGKHNGSTVSKQTEKENFRQIQK